MSKSEKMVFQDILFWYVSKLMPVLIMLYTEELFIGLIVPLIYKNYMNYGRTTSLNLQRPTSQKLVGLFVCRRDLILFNFKLTRCIT